MKHMNCKICDKKSSYIFSAKVLRKYTVAYYHCQQCGFLQTEEPYWLNEAYTPAHCALDTGVLLRNLSISKTIFVIIASLFDKKRSFLDFGGGYGTLTRLLRDKGLDFYSYDLYPENNIIAKGFDFDISKNRGEIELITSIECFEHFSAPTKELESMLSISKNIFFTTTLLPSPLPTPDTWDYFLLNQGQHISFYSLKTLQFLAHKYHLHLYSNGGTIHLLTEKKVSNKIFNLLLRFTNKGLYNFLSRKSAPLTGKDFFKINQML